MERNGYEWKALYFDRSDLTILTDYLIRAFPTAYLIGPDGNLSSLLHLCLPMDLNNNYSALCGPGVRYDHKSLRVLSTSRILT